MSDKNWEHYTAIYIIQANRKGWLGLWDQLIATLSGNNRLTVSTPVTFSVWARGDVSLAYSQIEEGPVPDIKEVKEDE